jgi:ABC-type multidrug transport system ATPase subunit
VAILHKGRLALTGSVKDLTSGQGYELVAKGVPEALKTELLKNALSSPAPSNGTFKVRLGTREAANQAIDMLRLAHCEIEALAATTSTLEEVFLATVEGRNGKAVQS